MARVKRAVNAQKKRRTVLDRASGYRGQRSRLYRKAKEQVTHSGVYAFRDRRARKGDMRRLWIQRINAAARAEGIPCVGSGSQPTTASYASDPRKSVGIRRLLREMGMPAPASSLSMSDSQDAEYGETTTWAR